MMYIHLNARGPSDIHEMSCTAYRSLIGPSIQCPPDNYPSGPFDRLFYLVTILKMTELGSKLVIQRIDPYSHLEFRRIYTDDS
jgi:hypothetical protein